MERINCLHIDLTHNTCTHPNYTSYTLGFEKKCIYSSNPGFACTNGCAGYVLNSIPTTERGLPTVSRVPPMPPVKPPKQDEDEVQAKLADWEKANQLLGGANGYYKSPKVILPGLAVSILADRRAVLLEYLETAGDYGAALRIMKKGGKVRTNTYMLPDQYLEIATNPNGEVCFKCGDSTGAVNSNYLISPAMQLAEDWYEVK